MPVFPVHRNRTTQCHPGAVVPGPPGATGQVNQVPCFRQRHRLIIIKVHRRPVHVMQCDQCVVVLMVAVDPHDNHTMFSTGLFHISQVAAATPWPEPEITQLQNVLHRFVSQGSSSTADHMGSPAAVRMPVTSDHYLPRPAHAATAILATGFPQAQVNISTPFS